MSLYLVTGGAGFIGSHLTEALLRDGHQVRVLDNLATGKRENIPAGAVFFEADFCDAEAISPAFVGVEGVFHVGALPRVPLSIAQPVETAKTNIMGTLNVLVAARDAKVKRVVYSASSSAYGNQDRLPLTTDMRPNPLNPYALQKYVGELFCQQFASLYGLETVSLRYFNVYGPRMTDDGPYVTVIAIFMRQLKAGETLTIDGDGEQTRDLTHVSDIVRANLAAMQSGKVGKGEVLNVGGGQRYSINFIASKISSNSLHRESPRGKGESRDTLADISLTKNLLDWEPTVEFEAGLEDLLRAEGIREISPPAIAPLGVPLLS